MIGRLKARGWGRTEAAWMGLSALVLFGAIVAFGYPSIIKTQHTERVEQHVTTTRRVPLSKSKTTVNRVDMGRPLIVVRREVRSLRAQIVSLRARARAEAKAAADAYCAAHDGCRGGRGSKGDRGSDGHDGMSGKDGRDAPPVHDLNSDLVDGVDNRVRDLETTVSGLIAQVDGLQRLIKALCYVLTPTRCQHQ